MSIALEYDQEKKIVYLTILEKLNLSKVADALKEINYSDNYPLDVGILLDTSSINVPIGNMQVDPDFVEIRKLFLEREKAKIAIITNDFTFGIGEKYEMLSETMQKNIMVFDNFMEGEEWLTGKRD
jgi:hypothetical protein